MKSLSSLVVAASLAAISRAAHIHIKIAPSMSPYHDYSRQEWGERCNEPVLYSAPQSCVQGLSCQLVVGNYSQCVLPEQVGQCNKKCAKGKFCVFRGDQNEPSQECIHEKVKRDHQCAQTHQQENPGKENTIRFDWGPYDCKDSDQVCNPSAEDKNKYMCQTRSG